MLLKGNGHKREKCKECHKMIYSNDYKYLYKDGVYCFRHGRVKSLHDGFMLWLSKAVRASNSTKE